jgi:hypothetical protein
MYSPTRQSMGIRPKLLDVTRHRLASASLREVRVIDVARAVDASPATTDVLLERTETYPRDLAQGGAQEQLIETSARILFRSVMGASLL